MTMLDLKNLAKTDPVKRNVEKGLEQVEHTPMEPPSAYDSIATVNVPADQLHDVLKVFVDEHKKATEIIEQFEQALLQYKTNGYKLDPKINEYFKQFFDFFDNFLLPHNSKEEKALFPTLNERLVQAGEHSSTDSKFTAIDVMEDDHVKFIQLGALTFNLLGLATRIQDLNARIFVLDTAYENGRELIELLRLHIFREDYTLFPLAQKYLKDDDFKLIEEKMARF